MHPVLKQLSSFGLVPVVKIDDIASALPLAKALCDGGLPCAEITFRTDAAEDAIRLISKELPDMLIGAGTVTTIEQVKRALCAGAKFIVSPGLNPKVVSYCIEKGVPITPGTSSASDIEVALGLGLDIVKFFPAEAVGGLKAIKALAAPYTTVKFMPTGGINSKNLGEYLAFDRIIAVGGSWMVDPKLVAAGDFTAITALTKEAVQNVMGFRFEHVCLNCENAEQAEKSAKLLCSLFGFEYKADKALFSGSEIACSAGSKGYITIGCRSVDRAISYFERRGVSLNRDSIEYDKNGSAVSLMFTDEIAGFGIRLINYK